jgi:predicted outer membrane repeat protein
VTPSKCTAIAIITVSVWVSSASAQRTIYVDADATGPVHDGSNWCQAYLELHAALAEAASDPNVDTILLAGGTYRPLADDPNQPREATFPLYYGWTLAGGYAGCGAVDPDARDIVAHETILSGDLNGDDDPNGANRGDNVYHVVSSALAGQHLDTRLDGLTIAGGNANGAYPDDSGGGLNSRFLQGLTVSQCTLRHNSASGNGGAIFSFYSSAALRDCTFLANSTGNNGGALYNSQVQYSLVNCIFNANLSSNNGGAIYNTSAATPYMTNCCFNTNAASGNGGAIYSEEYSNPMLANCILWDNTATTGPHIYDDVTTDSTTRVSYCCVSGGWPGTGNFSDDPAFVDRDGADDIAGTVDDDLRLAPGSPCIDAGDNLVLAGLLHEMSGSPRRIDDPLTPDTGLGAAPVVDLGPHEYGGAAIGEGTDCNGNGVLDAIDIAGGTSADTDGDDLPDECERVHNVTQGSLHLTIQEGIDAARHGDVVELQPGTHYECITIQAKVLTLRGAGGAGATTIDGHARGSVITCNTGDDPNTLITGLTITSGSAGHGGGMSIGYSSPSVVDCTFDQNFATYTGGGVNIHGGAPHITDCQFIGNSVPGQLSGRRGGGIFVSYSSPTIIRCTINDNVAQSGGGFASDLDSEPVVSNCTFNDNSATHNGGGMASSDSGTFSACTFARNTADRGGGVWFGGSAKLNGCTISNNSAETGGGVCSYRTSDPTLTDCTLTMNSAVDDGGGIYTEYASPRFVNCTVRLNTAAEGGGMYNHDYSTPVITGCTFTENTADYGGGGVYNDFYCESDFSYCTLSKNTADGGAGMTNYYYCGTRLAHCTVSENQAVSGGGGGLAETHWCSSKVIGCVFHGNSAAGDAGAYNAANCTPTLANCMFVGNIANGSGGAIRNSYSNARLSNCVFSANTAGDLGGALYSDTSNPWLVNCAFTRNAAGTMGGAVYSYSSSLPWAYNCIFWNDTAPTSPEIGHASSGILASYCCISGGYPGYMIVTSDPQFVDADGPDNTPGTPDDNLRVTAGSPCIDAGANDNVAADLCDLDGDGDSAEPTPLDFAYGSRFVDDPATTPDPGDPGTLGGPVVDMGAYEFGAGATADLDGDGDVDTHDFAKLQGFFGFPQPGPGDLDGSGSVDMADFEVFVPLMTGPKP